MRDWGETNVQLVVHHHWMEVGERTDTVAERRASGHVVQPLVHSNHRLIVKCRVQCSLGRRLWAVIGGRALASSLPRGATSPSSLLKPWNYWNPSAVTWILTISESRVSAQWHCPRVTFTSRQGHSCEWVTARSLRGVLTRGTLENTEKEWKELRPWGETSIHCSRRGRVLQSKPLCLYVVH